MAMVTSLVVGVVLNFLSSINLSSQIRKENRYYRRSNICSCTNNWYESGIKPMVLFESGRTYPTYLRNHLVALKRAVCRERA